MLHLISVLGDPIPIPIISCRLLSCGLVKHSVCGQHHCRSLFCTAGVAPKKNGPWALQIREILQAGMDAGKAGQGSNGSQEPETFFDAKDDADEELSQAEQVPGPGKITTLGRDAAQHLDCHGPKDVAWYVTADEPPFRSG